MEIVISIAAKIGEYLVAPIGRQPGYLIYYNSNMRTLKTQVENLLDIKGAVQLSVDEAKRRGEVIEPDVESWLTRVNGINEEVKRFLEDEVEAKQRYLKHYSLSRETEEKTRVVISMEAKEKTRVVIELRGQGSFPRVSYPAPPLATGSFTDFESRKSIIDEIMAALKDDSINAIGICGLGGIGKTTTVKEVWKRAKAEKLFDEIVMAVVSQTPDLKIIQGEIADKLCLQFIEESLPGRSDRLRARLMNSKRVLVILDDVWARLDLEAVGIPFGGDHKGCKVMLTSRSQDACNEMETCQNFSIGVLSEPEAWSLFKEKAGNSIDSPDLHPIAKDVVKECGGLPIAIVTVGRALKNKNKHAWDDALRQLRKSIPENILGMDTNVYQSLKLSYHLLESQEAKSCLLICCVFEEDANIPVEDLVRYGMGLGLFKSIDTLVEARDRVHTLVDKLKSCYLLLDGNHWNDEECVKMHDVVRDVIRSIATTEGMDKQYTSISLNISNKIYELPNWLDCPKLELLLLKGQDMFDDSLKAPDNLFEGMKELKVLELGNMRFVPPSLSILTNLQTLCLQDCRLKNISVIGELETLIILSFRKSSIKELPSEIGKLTQLRLLDLTDCNCLTTISPGVISSLIQLEELYMIGSCVQWEVEEEGKEKNIVNLAELQSLSRLIALETHLPTTKFPGSNFLFENLVRFKIYISFGGENNWFQGNQSWNELRLNFEASNPVESGINVLPKKIDVLELTGVKNPKDLIRMSFVHLKSLKLKSCDGLEYLIDTVDLVPHSIFSSLESLRIYDVNNLKMICHGQLPAGSFGKLTEVDLLYLPKLTHLWKGPTQLVSLGNLTSMTVVGCDRLENVFSQFVARGLVQLKCLEIRYCEMIEEIVATERGEHEKEATKSFCEKTDEIEFPRLRELRLEDLPKLRSFCPNSVGTQHLFNEKVTFPSMEELKLYFNDSVERIGNDQLPAGSLCKLRRMYVSSCNKLLNVGPSNLLQRLENLEELIVRDCSVLVEVCEIEGLNVEERDIVLLSKLKQLHLEDLPKLKHIWNSVFSKEPKGIHLFQSLSVLHVSGCNSLRNLFSPSMARSAKQLQEVLISKCKMMTEIVAKDKGEDDEKAVDKIEFPQLHRLVLSGLPNLVSFFPNANTTASKFLFDKKVSFPSLKELNLSNMNNLKGIWYIQLPTCPFSELRVLMVSHCDNLEEVTAIECDSREEVFGFKGRSVEEGHAVMLPRLEEMTLAFLPKLVQICKKDQEGTMGFQNIKSLTVKSCGSLRNLFYPSTARGLVHLERLDIWYCLKMEEIVAKGEEEEERTDKIVIPQLKSLILIRLPNLTSFCQGLFSFDLPSLDEVSIYYCPKMKTFSLGLILSTPKLEGVKVWFKGSFWMGDLNNTIKQLFERKD